MPGTRDVPYACAAGPIKCSSPVVSATGPETLRDGHADYLHTPVG